MYVGNFHARQYSLVRFCALLEEREREREREGKFPKRQGQGFPLAGKNIETGSVATATIESRKLTESCVAQLFFDIVVIR